jgi:uncharacterized protein
LALEESACIYTTRRADGSSSIDVLNFVLSNITGSLLQVANTSGQSTALHWAAVNSHLAVAKALVLHPGGPGPLLIDVHNAAGLSPLGEAELAGADEVAKWLVEVMTIEQKPIIGDENEVDGDDVPEISSK